MIVLHGKGVCGGMAKGVLHFIEHDRACIPRETVQSQDEEKKRFLEAQAEVVKQLNHLAEHCRQELGHESAALFETHALLAEDEDFTDSVLRFIVEESCCAQYAVDVIGKQFSQMLAALDDDYMRARSADVLDVSNRIIRVLTGASENTLKVKQPSILVADDLSPSETLHIERDKVLGLVLENSSETGHTAILARAMGIPAVCGIQNLFSLRGEYGTAYLDGESGELIVHPSTAVLDAWQKKYMEQEAKRFSLRSLVGAADVTRDGTPLRLYCNIGSADDLASVKLNDGQGIGLFRSEFLFLHRDSLPDEDAQFSIYRSLAEGMGTKPVIIRTLDIGSDKQIPYLPLPAEENPALGLRGIRVSLSMPELFKTQLRAIYRASAYGNLAVMFPMVTSVWEVQECRKMCRQVMDELSTENQDFCRNLEVGVMIETPAAVFIAAELCAQVDFFSIGTNDLTQYTLACDRQSSHLEKFFDPHHPAIARALKAVIDVAHANGKWVGICGELAADLTMLPLFLKLGVDELSVSPPSVLPVRQAWRALDRRTQVSQVIDGTFPID